MKPKILLFSLLCLLSFSLVAAVSIDTNKDEYTGAEKVEIVVAGCSQLSSVKVSNADYLVFIKQGTGSWKVDYNTASSTYDGKYKAVASCLDGTKAEVEFCVDKSGCLGVVPPDDEEGGVGGGQGRGGCRSKLSCTVFSYCNNKLQRERTCTDLNNCRRPYTETVSCEACEYDWNCYEWLVCANGRQTRTCVDNHLCGTNAGKPITERPCSEEKGCIESWHCGDWSVCANNRQVRVCTDNNLCGTYRDRPLLQQSCQEKVALSFWEKYKWWILGGLILLLLLIIILILLLTRKHHERVVYNLDELKSWIKKEKAMKTSEEDMRHILAEKTGWVKQEVDKAFGEIKNEEAKIASKFSFGKQKSPLNRGKSSSKPGAELISQKFSPKPAERKNFEKKLLEKE